MNINNEILNKLGLILVSSAPESAIKVIMKAEPNLEGDVCKYQFNYFDKNSNYNEYDPDGLATLDILDVLVELRNTFIEENLTNDNPIWIGCIVIVDIEKAKINIDFKYEPFIEE